MDLLSLLGIVVAFAAVIGGNWLEGGHIDSLINLPAFVIVLGGSIGAVLLQTPFNVFARAVRLLKYAFFPPKYPMKETAVKLVRWGDVARKQGLLELEGTFRKESDVFMRKGMSMVVDGSDPEEIRRTMEVELDQQEQRDIAATRVYTAMGGYAPTIGIIGAVMGLIQVMQNLDDPARLGDGIATAFIATIYGVALANMFMLPIAAKLKSYVEAESIYRELVIEGLVSIAEGENPRVIESRLHGFIRK